MRISAAEFITATQLHGVSDNKTGVGTNGHIVGWLDKPSDWLTNAEINVTEVTDVDTEDGVYSEIRNSVWKSNGREFLTVSEEEPYFELRK